LTSKPIPPGEKQRPDRFPNDNPRKDVRGLSVGDDQGNPGGRHLLGGLELGPHPPGPSLPFPDESIELGRHRGHGLDSPSARVASRVVAVETIDVRQDDQEIRVHKMGHDRGEVVIVSHLDLVDGHGVVFVDHGEDPVAQQGEEGVPRIQVSGTMGQILLGQEDLRDSPVEAAEGPLVAPHQSGLSDSRRRLLLWNRPRALPQAEPGGPGRHRA